MRNSNHLFYAVESLTLMMNNAAFTENPELREFLRSKPDTALNLFDGLLAVVAQYGEISVHPAKSMIAIASTRKFAYVIQFGKTFIDVVLPFKTAYADNLCFRKIKPVPRSDDFNHHLRICSAEDFNEEVTGYLKLAYQEALS